MAVALGYFSPQIEIEAVGGEEDGGAEDQDCSKGVINPFPSSHSTGITVHSSPSSVADISYEFAKGRFPPGANRNYMGIFCWDQPRGKHTHRHTNTHS